MRSRLPAGSALILAVVLTSLLAVVGVLFVMVSRVDRISTSAISENRELNLAVDTVVARIARELTWDVPGVNTLEYYDYPDLNNNWLASLEPCDVDPRPLVGDYRWHQISNLTGNGAPWENLAATIIPDYQDGSAVVASSPADADGDGVADSLWIRLSDMTSSKGRPIFAAIRVVDNGAMINLNTAYYFDPAATTAELVDGSRLAQIHLLAFSKGSADDPNDVHRLRCNLTEPDLLTFNDQCAIRVENPDRTSIAYLPFDISDELELRNRFVLDAQYSTSRIETALRVTLTFPAGATYRNRAVPITSGSLGNWQEMMDPAYLANQYYNYRKLLTTYNMDRIITPDGVKMVNVNIPDVPALYGAVLAGLLRANVANPDKMAAQIAVNIADYVDDNNDVTTFSPPGDPNVYGFERPCIYISELGHRFDTDPGDPARPEYMSYAIELYNDYSEENDPFDIDISDPWRLAIYDALIPPNPPVLNRTETISWSGTGRFHMIVFEDPSASLVGEVDYWKSVDGPSPPDGETRVSPDIKLSWDAVAVPGAATHDVYFGTDSNSVENATTTSAEYMARQDPCEYDPVGSLTRGTTYYWRIDGVDAGGAVIGDPGDVWKFTVAASAGDEASVQTLYIGAGESIFSTGSVIELQRRASDGSYVVVDSVEVPAGVVNQVRGIRSYQRDMTRHKCIRRLWDDGSPSARALTLGHSNSYVDADPSMIQAHPANANFTNVGEIGMVFRQLAYHLPGIDPATSTAIGYRLPPEMEDEVRINLADPAYQQIFNYVTVFDPVNDFIDNDGDGLGVDGDGNGVLDPYEEDPDELKVAGRININTAPWFVIAQLPWMTPELAQAVVAYRDKLELVPGVVDYSGGRGRGMVDLSGVNPPAVVREEPGFASVAELVNVTHSLAGAGVYNPLYDMRKYGRDNADQTIFPDLTDTDEAEDDFEERDLIFARISNLVTVRSDVFTVYILVRIGRDGPQRRVVAILDRSNVYGAGNIVGKVAVRALHPVPDPR